MRIEWGPRPSRDAAIDSQGYWDALAAGQFRVQRCTGCGLLRHYPRPMCAACRSMDVEWVPVSGRAVVRSWTVCHHAFLPNFKDALPYVLALAELEEGVRVNLPLAGVSPAALRVGLPVRLRIATDEGGVPYPLLEPTGRGPSNALTRTGTRCSPLR